VLHHTVAAPGRRSHRRRFSCLLLLPHTVDRACLVALLLLSFLSDHRFIQST
jgi:hypothetical protein